MLATLSIDPLKYGYIIDTCYNSGLKFRRLSLKIHLVMLSSGYSVVLFFPGWPVNLQYSFGSSRDPLARLKAVTKCQDLFLVPTGNDWNFLDFPFSHGGQGLLTSTAESLKGELNVEFMNYNNLFLNIKDSNLVVY